MVFLLFFSSFVVIYFITHIYINYKIINERIFIDHQELAQIYRIPCPNNCGHSYSGAYRYYNLKRHLTFECGVEPKFQCTFCQKRFRHKSALKTHQMLVHKKFP